MPETDKQTTATKTAKRKRKDKTPYHAAAFSVFKYLLSDYVKNGDVELSNEHPLSKEPLKIDIIVLRKNRDVEIKRSWGRIFRTHNLIEYKSPVDSPLSLSVFNKVIHGYSGIYASQEEIKFTDMTATIVCEKKPTELFNQLRAEFHCKILRKDKGIYYICQKGMPENKALAVQIVVYSELSDDDGLLLKALQKETDRAMVKKLETSLPLDDDELAYWWHVMLLLKGETLLKEFDMNRWKSLMEAQIRMGKIGYHEQQWFDNGIQQGVQQLFDFWASGHTIEEAKKKFAIR